MKNPKSDNKKGASVDLDSKRKPSESDPIYSEAMKLSKWTFDFR